jgi:hypothetical protein
MILAILLLEIQFRRIKMETKRSILNRGWLRVGFLCLGTFSIILLNQAWAQEAFTTQKTVIFYTNASDLATMDSQIRTPPARPVTLDRGQSQFSAELAAKVDGLLEEVCMAMKRWPKVTARLRIILLSNGRQVRQRQLAFDPESEGGSIFGYGELEAFYDPLTNSIFLSLADLNDGILAHEMAHYVMCTASAVIPPHEMQEEWAHYADRYVEMRLN